MKTFNSYLCAAAIALALVSGTNAMASRSLHSTPQAVRAITLVYTPATDLLYSGTHNTEAPVVSGTLMIPMFTQPALLDGGDDGGEHHHGGGHHGDDDSTGGDNDSTHDGGRDSSFSGGNGSDSTFADGDDDNDSTEHHGGMGGRGDDDSTNVGDTTNGGGHCGGGHDGRDSSGFADNDNDTLDCGHHGHGDTTATNDTAFHTMFGGNAHNIIIRSNNGSGTATIYLTNNLATSVKLTSASLALGSNFKLVGKVPTMMSPMTIAAGAKAAFKVTFAANDANAHTDQLLFTTNSAQVVSPVLFTGINQIQASVSTVVPAGVTISMAPNPMANYTQVNVTGVNSADLAIYDMTGKVVRTAALTGSTLYFNGASNDGAAMAAGSYLVRISGVATDGTAFVTTRQLILQK